MNLRLKKEIIGSGHKCFEIANALAWHPSKVSRVINETYTPSDTEKDQLAQIIGVPVKDIFQSQEKVEA